MRQPYFTKRMIVFLVLSWATCHPLPAQDGSPYGAAPPAPGQEQPEVLTRGPVHEAFAEPVNLQYEAGLVVPPQPPADIEEIPPTDRPAGAQFVWVPGYWAWDSERDSYIWISGCWRAAPQNMYWVPGYWAQVPDGWEWISGFWTPVSNVRQIEYLPSPPALDEEMPGNPPSPDTIWVPACWYWDQGQYIRRPGYWLQQQPGWIWVPSHYRWTPRGYVFDQGHWDYSLERRGVLFAPVYFPRSVYTRSRYTYSPSIIIDMGVLSVNLFTYPRYSHYYFGDYYDDAYLRIGIYPQFESGRRHTWYDPIYQHNRWRYGRADNRWEEHQRQEYDHRRADKDLRPPRTYREQETRRARLPEPQRKNKQMAEPLRTAVTGKAAPFKFEQIKNDGREKLSKHSTDVYKFREERSRWESPGADRKTVSLPIERKDSATRPDRTDRTDRGDQPNRVEQTNRADPIGRVDRADRVKIPDSPVVGKRSFWSAFKKGPPSRPADERKTQTKVQDTRKGKNKENKK